MGGVYVQAFSVDLWNVLCHLCIHQDLVWSCKIFPFYHMIFHDEDISCGCYVSNFKTEQDYYPRSPVHLSWYIWEYALTNPAHRNTRGIK